MKKLKFLVALSFIFGMMSVSAQSVLGTYNQKFVSAPNKIKNQIKNKVVVSKDAREKNKIWVANLLGSGKFYAVGNIKNEDTEIYSVPKQVAAGYAVNFGCIIYDKEEKNILIALNNKTNCQEVSQSDYGEVSVGADGNISVPGVKVGKDGSVKTDGVKVDKKGVSVNSGKLLEGVQYNGTKQ